MTGNSRFAVSLHMLAYLACRHSAAVPSAEIAASVVTNPVVIRRLLSALTQARLVTAQKGAAGGFALALTPGNISLLSVYRAVNPSPRHGFTRIAPNIACPVGAKIQSILVATFLKAQSRMEAALARVSIATIHLQPGPVCSLKR